MAKNQKTRFRPRKKLDSRKKERKHAFDQEISKIQEKKKENTKKKSRKPRYLPHYQPEKSRFFDLFFP